MVQDVIRCCTGEVYLLMIFENAFERMAIGSNRTSDLLPVRISCPASFSSGE